VHTRGDGKHRWLLGAHVQSAGEDFEVLLVNVQHVKPVPGRRTDASDSEWLAELLMHGLVKPSFIPPRPQRALRDLTRYQTKLVEERVRVANRLQNGLESVSIKLGSVVSDVVGAAAREMLAGLSAGETDLVLLADLVWRRLRN
jgi:transposase